jgi:hypothetical protein
VIPPPGPVLPHAGTGGPRSPPSGRDEETGISSLLSPKRAGRGNSNQLSPLPQAGGTRKFESALPSPPSGRDEEIGTSSPLFPKRAGRGNWNQLSPLPQAGGTRKFESALPSPPSGRDEEIRISSPLSPLGERGRGEGVLKPVSNHIKSSQHLSTTSEVRYWCHLRDMGARSRSHSRESGNPLRKFS